MWFPLGHDGVQFTDEQYPLFPRNSERFISNKAHDPQNNIEILEGISVELEFRPNAPPPKKDTLVITGFENTTLDVEPDTLIFTPQNTTFHLDLSQKTTLTAQHDPDEMDEEITLTLTSSLTGDSSTRSVLIVDDDKPISLGTLFMFESHSRSFNFPVVTPLPNASGDVRFTITGHEGKFLDPHPTELLFRHNSPDPIRLTLNALIDDNEIDDQVILLFTASGGGYDGKKLSLTVNIIDRPAYELLIPEGETRAVTNLHVTSNLNILPSNVTSTWTGHSGTDLTIDPNPVDHDPNLYYRCRIDKETNGWCSPLGLMRFTADHDTDDTDDQIILKLQVDIPESPNSPSAQLNVRIEDDDDPGIMIDPQILTITEGTEGTFSVKLTAPPSGVEPVTIVIPESVGDLTRRSLGTLTFRSENWDGFQDVTLYAEHDDDSENEVPIPFWIRASGSGFDRERGRVDVTIVDDDLPSIIVDPTELTIDEGKRKTFTINLKTQPSASVTIPIPSVGDLEPDLDQVMFPLGDWERAHTVTLTARPDDDFDDDKERITLTASGGDYQGVTKTLNVTITDNDIENADIIIPQEITLKEGGSAGLFPVRLSELPNGTVTVAVSQQTETDLTLPSPESLEFTVSNWDQNQNIKLGASHDDDLIDDREIVTLTASGGGYTGVSNTIQVNITDDDHPTIKAPTTLTVPEGGDHSFKVSLSAQPSKNVTISIPAEGDLTPDPQRLSFTPSTWKGEQMVTLTAASDDDSEDDQLSLLLKAAGGKYTDAELTIDVTITDDDLAQLIVDPKSLTIDEGQSESFRVKLKTQPLRDVEVSMTTSKDGLRLSQSKLTFTNSSWNVNQTVNVIALDDPDSNDDTITIILDAANYGTDKVTESIIISVRDGDISTYLPAASLMVSSTSILEGTSLEIEVNLSEALSIVTDIPLAIQNLTTDSEDYGSLSSVTIQEGSLRGTASLSMIDDGIYEGNERFVLTFGSLPSSVRRGDPSFHRIEIIDASEPPRVILDATPTSIKEGDHVTVMVNLSSALPHPMTVPLMVTPETAQTSDYEFDTPFEVAFSARSQQETLRIMAKTDQEVEREETFLIGVKALSPPLMSEFPAPISVSILDQTEPKIEAREFLSIPEGDMRTVQVALTAQPFDQVTLEISGDPQKLDITPITLSFTQQDWDQSKGVAFVAREDMDIIQDLPVNVTLIANGGGYIQVRHQISIEITEESIPQMIVEPRSLELDENQTKTFEVYLNQQPSAIVTVNLTATHGESYLKPLSPPSLTFTASNYRQPKEVRVTAQKDEDSRDASETIMVHASGGGYENAQPITVDIKITDQDEEPIRIFIEDGEANESDPFLQLPIRLSRSTDRVITVLYSTEDGTADANVDYVDSRGIVIFDPGATRGVVQFDLHDDTSAEGNETFIVTLASPSSNAEIGRPRATATIVDNDGITSIAIEDAVAVTNAPVVSFTIRLSHPSSEAILVHYRTENGSATAGEDYLSTSGLITFAPGAVHKTIEVPLLADSAGGRKQKNFYVHLESSDTAEMEKSIATAVIEKKTTAAERLMTAYTSRFVRTASIHLTEAVQERLQPYGSTCSAIHRAELSQLWQTAYGWSPSLGELLSGCRISKATHTSGRNFGVWGRGAFRRFHGREDHTATLQGDVSTALFGVDYRWSGGWMIGLMAAHHQGSGSFEPSGVTESMNAQLTGIYPYVSYEASEWEIWMSGGYGWGNAQVPELRGDLSSRFGAIGFRANLTSTTASRLNYFGDVFLTDVETLGTRAEVVRVRLGVESGFQIHEWIRPYVEANVRQDGGDAETGIGLEFGGGLRMSYPQWKLRGEVRSQGLVLHSANGYQEWGISGSIQAGHSSQGLMMRIRPSWGSNHGMSLHHQQTIQDAISLQSGATRTEVELGYGTTMKGATARSTLGMTQLQSGRILRLGGELRPLEWISISVSGLAHHRQSRLGEMSINVHSTFSY